jgi:hypothetical protein
MLMRRWLDYTGNQKEPAGNPLALFATFYFLPIFRYPNFGVWLLFSAVFAFCAIVLRFCTGSSSTCQKLDRIRENVGKNRR